MVATPALDKQHEAIENGHSDSIGSFLDWLSEKGYVIARWEHYSYEIEPRRLVFNQAVPNKPGSTKPAHRTTSKDQPALCGARPQPYTVDGQERKGSWYGEFSSGWSKSDVCITCQSMYDQHIWPQRQSEQKQLFGVHKPINDWLSEYFGIDQDAIERERRALLEELRAKK